MTKKEYQEADRRLEKGIRELSRLASYATP